MRILSPLVASLLFAFAISAAENDIPIKFRAVTIDEHLERGIAVAIADVDGDGKNDIIVADLHRVVWYRNPTWEKFILAESVPGEENVSLGAQVLEGRIGIAVGTSETTKDGKRNGSLYYFAPRPDRTKRWDPVLLAKGPVIKCLGWHLAHNWQLIAVPFNGTSDGQDDVAEEPVLEFEMPDEDVRQAWKTRVVTNDMHMRHSLVTHDLQPALSGSVLIGGEEGIRLFGDGVLPERGYFWEEMPFLTESLYEPIGKGEVREVRVGRFNRERLLATIESMDGRMVTASIGLPSNYSRPWRRSVLSKDVGEAHALQCGDFRDHLPFRYQVVAGFVAGAFHPEAKGIKMWTAKDESGSEWVEADIDDSISCEDLQLSDLSLNRGLNIIACGGSTHDVKIYFSDMQPVRLPAPSSK
jgi:hypothetical protein